MHEVVGAFTHTSIQLVAAGLLSPDEVLHCHALTRNPNKYGSTMLRDPLLHMRLQLLFQAAKGKTPLTASQATAVRLVKDIVPAHWPDRDAAMVGADALHTLAVEAFKALQDELQHYLHWGLTDAPTWLLAEEHMAEAKAIMSAIKADIQAHSQVKGQAESPAEVAAEDSGIMGGTESVCGTQENAGAVNDPEPGATIHVAAVETTASVDEGGARKVMRIK